MGTKTRTPESVSETDRVAGHRTSLSDPHAAGPSRSLPVSSHSISRWALFAICALSVLAQGIVLSVNSQASTTSNVLIAVVFLFAALGCLQNAYRGPVETRTLWILIASGFFLSIAGQIGSTYNTLTHVNETTALTPDFFFVIYGIPILLAISFTNDDADLKVLFWLDGAQALLAALLTYLQIFSTLPSLGHPTPISAIDLMYLYNVENFILAGAVAVRLFANPSPAKKYLYRILSIYLWAYALVALIAGYMELEHNAAEGLQDVAWGIPSLLLLAALAFWPFTSKAEGKIVKDRKNRSVALLIDNLSPILLTLIIVIMGARIAPAHLWIGFVSIAAAVALYGVRAALLQSKFVQSQHELAKSGLALVDAIDRLRELSIRDGLTGIHNRRHFDEVLLAEWKRSMRTDQPLSLLLIDVDCFKELNDRYGHPEGDECLKKIAQQLARKLRRSNDVIARYGGEEFAAILPGTSKESAQLIADAMRISVADLKIANEGSKVASFVTVSVGVCSERTSLDRSPEELLSTVDAALYLAKKQGRNCVQLAG